MKATDAQTTSSLMPVLLADTPAFAVHKYSIEVQEFKVRPATAQELRQLIEHYEGRRHR